MVKRRDADTLISAARELGLEVDEIGNGKKHGWIRFRDARGRTIKRVVPHSKSSPSDIGNSRAELRRFARGQSHGLIVGEQK